MGYHVAKIKKGILGEASKIREELEELEDAELQGNPVMALVELSDMCGAISAYLEKHHPTITMSHLLKMAEATASAFKDGTRKTKTGDAWISNKDLETLQRVCGE